MDGEEYKAIFPNVSLSADSKSAGRWETNKGGEYFAAGVGGAITGRCRSFNNRRPTFRTVCFI